MRTQLRGAPGTERRRDVRLSARQRARERLLVREAAKHEALDARRAGPVAVHGRELDPARLHGHEPEGPGAHGGLLACQELLRALHGEERLRQRRQQRRVRPVERELDHVRAYALGAPLEGVPLAQMLEVGGDGGGVERGRRRGTRPPRAASGSRRAGREWPRRSRGRLPGRSDPGRSRTSVSHTFVTISAATRSVER